MGQARESRPDTEEQTPVQSVEHLLAAEHEEAAVRTGFRRKVVLRDIDRVVASRANDVDRTPQPLPTLPPDALEHAPFSPPSLDTASLILKGQYLRTKVPSVKTIDDSFLGRLKEGEPFIVGTVAFFAALLVAGIVFLVVALAR